MTYQVVDLLALMQRLRDPKQGCPWDISQTFKSIVPHTLEECYELVDAIEQGDTKHIKEELGDVFFQVVFYAQLAAEQQDFDFSDVVDSLTEKLIRRHPHVFPGGQLNSGVDQQHVDTKVVKEQWEAIKSIERKNKQQHSILDDIPQALPAQTRAYKLQKRASNAGFDWPNIDGALEKLHEEIGELIDAKNSQKQDAIEDEMGDVLFSCINIARHLQVDPEQALRRTNRKFEQRFGYVEAVLKQREENLGDVGLVRLEALWQEAKAKV